MARKTATVLPFKSAAKIAGDVKRKNREQQKHLQQFYTQQEQIKELRKEAEKQELGFAQAGFRFTVDEEGQLQMLVMLTNSQNKNITRTLDLEQIKFLQEFLNSHLV